MSEDNQVAPKQVQNTQFNEMSIITGILCLVFTPAAFVTGIIALKQIEKSKERGKGIAITGIVLGGIFLALVAIIFILFVVGVATTNVTSPSYY